MHVLTGFGLVAGRRRLGPLQGSAFVGVVVAAIVAVMHLACFAGHAASGTTSSGAVVAGEGTVAAQAVVARFAANKTVITHAAVLVVMGSGRSRAVMGTVA